MQPAIDGKEERLDAILAELKAIRELLELARDAGKPIQHTINMNMPDHSELAQRVAEKIANGSRFVPNKK